MTKIRGFEIIKKYEGKEIELPKRATKSSAGYDFQAAEDIVIPSAGKIIAKYLKTKTSNLISLVKGVQLTEEDLVKLNDLIKPTLVPTGIKSYMGDEEYLQLANRSSNPIKKKLILANGVGIIDSDYYNNSDNEGHIMFQFINYGIKDVQIKKGDAIGQGIFLPFLKSDNDNSSQERTGGFGSSDK